MRTKAPTRSNHMDDQPLKDQKALVKGASSGIGEGVARAVGAAGALPCRRDAAPYTLRRRPRHPIQRAARKIICISSVHEVIPWAGHVNYAASKGGVGMFMKSLAQELAPHRIRVNSVAPGAIMT